MTTYKVNQIYANLDRLIDEAAESHQPIIITGKRNNAVLVSEHDWRLLHGVCAWQYIVKKGQKILIYNPINSGIFALFCLILPALVIPCNSLDWSAIQETLCLLSVPGMRESIKEGLATSIEECTRKSYW